MVRGAVARELDSAEAGPKGGKIDLWAGLTATDDAGFAGVGLDASGRLNSKLSVFARGRAGYQWDAGGGDLSVEALAGLRYRF